MLLQDWRLSKSCKHVDKSLPTWWTMTSQLKTNSLLNSIFTQKLTKNGSKIAIFSPFTANIIIYCAKFINLIPEIESWHVRQTFMFSNEFRRECTFGVKSDQSSFIALRHLLCSSSSRVFAAAAALLFTSSSQSGGCCNELNSSCWKLTHSQQRVGNVERRPNTCWQVIFQLKNYSIVSAKWNLTKSLKIGEFHIFDHSHFPLCNK